MATVKKTAAAPALVTTEATTKSAAKKGKPADVANIDDARQAREDLNEIKKQTAAVMAELEAARAEIAALRASGGKKGGREAQRAAWLAPIDADKMADAATTLGKLERLDRNAVIQAGYKALGRVRMADLPGLVETIASKAAEGGGMYGDATAETITADCLEVRPRAARSKKK